MTTEDSRDPIDLFGNSNILCYQVQKLENRVNQLQLIVKRMGDTVNKLDGLFYQQVRPWLLTLDSRVKNLEDISEYTVKCHTPDIQDTTPVAEVEEPLQPSKC